MELRKSVNAATENPPPASQDDVFPPPIATPKPTSSVQTMCLYIGPAGQRCGRTAGESGFCSKHRLVEPEEVSNSAAIKRALAIIGVLAALWPFIADLIREILRLLR